MVSIAGSETIVSERADLEKQFKTPESPPKMDPIGNQSERLKINSQEAKKAKR